MKVKYDVATLMQNVKICEGYVVYIPIASLVGNYNNMEGFFQTTDGNSYFDLEKNSSVLDLSDSYMCSYILTSDEFNYKYNDCRNFSEALIQYRRDYTNFKLLRYDIDTSENKCVEFGLEDLDRLGLDSDVIQKSYDIGDNNFEDIDLSLDASQHEAIRKSLIQFICEYKDNEEILSELFNVLDLKMKCYREMLYRMAILNRARIDSSVDANKAFDEKLDPSVFGLAAFDTKKIDEKVVLKKETKPLKTQTLSKSKLYEQRKNLIEEVKKIVIGQDEQIEDLVVEIFRLQNQYGKKNKGILLTGSTGVGKTKICTLISEKLNIPCKIIDTTQLTIPGYKGKDIKEYLEELYDQENENQESVEKALIIFDEIDKKGSHSNSDVSGKGVINLLLKFLDGTEYAIRDAQPYLPSEKRLISTKNMIVIFAGSFNSIYQNPKFNKQLKTLGFSAKELSTSVQKKEPTIEDFVELGGMPDEALGRFPVVVHLNNLNKNDLKNILLQSLESDIREAKLEFIGEAGVELEFTDDAIEQIAEVAYAEKTGARSLNKIVKCSTRKSFIDVTNNIGKYKKIIITKDTVLDNNKYIKEEVSTLNNHIKQYKK